MKIRDRSQKTFGAIILISTLTALLLVSVSTACIAEDGYSAGLRVRQKKSDKKAARRAARKHEQKAAEKTKRKDASRDTLRLDHKIEPATVKITDAKIVDRKYTAGEMKRERKEAGPTEEKISVSRRPPDSSKARAKDFHLEREKRDSFYETGF